MTYKFLGTLVDHEICNFTLQLYLYETMLSLFINFNLFLSFNFPFVVSSLTHMTEQPDISWAGLERQERKARLQISPTVL